MAADAPRIASRSPSGHAAPVHFEACEIDEFFSMGGQYHGSLVLERCTIFGRTDLSCGGHGTNLLNQNIARPTRFRVAPLIEDNQGNLAAFEPKPTD